MAELADALALGASGRKAVQVQVLCPAPTFPGNMLGISTASNCNFRLSCIENGASIWR